MALLVLALLFVGMLVTFVALAAKTSHKAPRAVVVPRSTTPDLFVPVKGHEAPRAAFPRGTRVL